MTYTPQEQKLLARYFSVLDRRDHADIYLVRNLPPEVAATLNGVYSRSHLSMRDNFLQRLKKGLAESGTSLDAMDLGDVEPDVLTDVLADRSGKFLKTYAIDHGHNSLREGSILHIAVENVSQLVTRFIQRERRCSFEESSTRYISFSEEGHWRDPDVMATGGEVARAYEETLRTTFALYQQLTERLVAFLTRRRPLEGGEQPAAYQRALRAEAFDAARYLLTPAVFTKWGFVLDARTLSDVVTELLSHPLAEFRLVGQRLKEQGDTVVPTLLSHAKPNPFLSDQHRVLAELATELDPADTRGRSVPNVSLVSWDRDLDCRLLASLVYEHSHARIEELRRLAREMSTEQRQAMLTRALSGRGKHDALPLPLEGTAPFEFEVLVDFGAYRDIGRHRKGFQQQQMMTAGHGYVVPPLIEEAGLADIFRDTMATATANHNIVAAAHPHAAAYITPFAFLQRVRLIFDPRQIAYFIELRSGPEGHFAYRNVAIDMFREVQRVSPLFAQLIRVQLGGAFLGRLETEQAADDRRRQRMLRAGDLPTDSA
ncbi:MAG: FAD-dependent thymidylate synthase [Planctomycetota bacterium]